jgi:hypothetical protein
MAVNNTIAGSTSAPTTTTPGPQDAATPKIASKASPLVTTIHLPHGPTGGSGNTVTGGGGQLPPPANTPLESVPLGKLKSAFDTGALFTLLMEIAKAAQKTHNMALQSSFQEQANFQALNSKQRTLGMQSALSNYDAQSKQAYGKLAEGGVTSVVGMKGVFDVRSSMKDAGQITKAKGQVKSNNESLSTAEKTFDSHKGSLEARLKNAEHIQRTEGTIAAKQADLKQVGQEHQEAVDLRNAKNKAAKEKFEEASLERDPSVKDQLKSEAENLKSEARQHQNDAGELLKEKMSLTADLADHHATLSNAHTERESLLPQEVRDAKSGIHTDKQPLEKQRASAQAEADHWRSKADAEDAQAASDGRAPNGFLRDLQRQHEGEVTRLTRDIGAHDNKLGKLADDHHSVDGLDAQLQQKHTDIGKLKQDTHDKNQKISDGVSHLDPDAKTRSVPLLSALANGLGGATGGSFNMAGAGSQRDADMGNVEKDYARGEGEVANMSYSQKKDLADSSAGTRDAAINAVGEVMKNMNDTSQRIANA